MKIKTLSRNEEEFTRERKSDVQKVFRNADPKLHPFEKAREYIRALNAVKHERLFAKPFIGALDGHSDGIYCMSLVPSSLVDFLSGACDGGKSNAPLYVAQSSNAYPDARSEIKLWNLTTRKATWSWRAHEGFVRGLCCNSAGTRFISCGTDQTIKMWRLWDSHVAASMDTTAATVDSDDEDAVSDDDADAGPSAMAVQSLHDEEDSGMSENKTGDLDEAATARSKVRRAAVSIAFAS